MSRTEWIREVASGRSTGAELRRRRLVNPPELRDRLARLVREKAIGTHEHERDGHSRSLLELEALVGALVVVRVHPVKLPLARARHDGPVGVNHELGGPGFLERLEPHALSLLGRNGLDEGALHEFDELVRHRQAKRSDEICKGERHEKNSYGVTLEVPLRDRRAHRLSVVAVPAPAC
jgi:hypothetical protein